ncbi:MAG TPA: hypothetical protein VNX68_16425, partial [Nitrosopumilaceae archaeon]|nr:hypothetical protein [Nitrosopumilaceae archaeon]
MNITTKTKVVTGFIVAVLISGIACFFSYNSLKSFSYAVDDLSKENQRLASVKNILRSIDGAEGEVDNYILNQKGNRLDTIGMLLDDVAEEVKHLNLLCRNNPQQLNIVLGIDSVLNNQIEWFYGFISFKNQGANDLFYKKLSDKLTTMYKSDSVKKPVLTDENKGKESPGFFSRLLGKRKKKESEDRKISQQGIQEKSISEGTTTRYKINKIIKEVQNSQLQNKKALVQKELDMLKENKGIKKQLYDLVNKFESNEIVFAKQKAQISKAETEEATITLAIITMLGILSFIVFSIFIIRDISKGNKLKSELIASRREAMKLARSKEEFLANMSHEIRTP